MTTSQKTRIFSHAIMVLFEKAPQLDDIKTILSKHGNWEELPQQANANEWLQCGTALTKTIETSGETYIIDIVDDSWPDLMDQSNPKSSLFQAWALTGFGFHTYPQSMSHAAEQGFHWNEAKKNIGRHKSFVRLRRSGNKEIELPQIPQDASSEKIADILHQWRSMVYDSIDFQSGLEVLKELAFLAGGVMQLPGALAYFNPAGEKVAPKEHLLAALENEKQTGLTPLSIFIQTRQIITDDEEVVVDTCGAELIGVRDIQTIIPADLPFKDAVENFFLNVIDYCHKQGTDIIKDGDTIPNGPGGISWSASWDEDCLMLPPRWILTMEPLFEE